MLVLVQIIKKTEEHVSQQDFGETENAFIFSQLDCSTAIFTDPSNNQTAH